MRCRSFLLPLLALVAVAVVIGLQLAAGGADYEPPEPRAACTEAQNRDQVRSIPPENADMERLTEYVVIGGVEEAACELDVSRERLLLALPSRDARASVARAAGVPPGDVIATLKEGLRHTVRELGAARRFPAASALLEDYASEIGIPGLLAGAVTRVPDRVIDGLLPTGEVLTAAIDRLDLEALIAGIDDPQQLESELRSAIGSAALDVARQRIRESLQFWR